MTDWASAEQPSDAAIIELRNYREVALPRLALSTTLFGRSRELHSILELLADPSVRLVSLTGRAGVGKTRLALEVARTLMDEDQQPVSFVSLASVPSADMVLAEIVSQVGLGGNADAGPALIARRLRGHLLVLDNFEQVLDATGAVTVLLENSEGLQVLVTSQSPLRLQFERVVRIAPLPLPEHAPRDQTDLSEQPAVAFYCDRARAVDDRFRFGDHNAEAVAALCRELEGLPLAIELAAARAVTLSAAEVARLISDRRLDVLHAARHGVPERHHDLRQALDWTYQLLGPNECDLLMRLSVVGGEFDVDDVEALLEDRSAVSLDALSELVDLHLVEPVPGVSARFELLPSIREFADEKLEASGERDHVETCFIRWLADRAQLAAHGLDAPGPDPWLRWIHDAETVLLRAVRLCLERDHIEEACDLLSALAPLWNSGSFTPAHRQLMEEVVVRAPQQMPAMATYNDLLLWSGLLLVRQLEGDWRQLGQQRLEQGRDLAHTVGDDRLRLRALYFDVLAAPMTGGLEPAVAKNAEGLKLAQEVGSDLWKARFELRTAMVALGFGEHQQALEWGQSALDTAERVGDGTTLLLATIMLWPLVRARPELALSIPPPEELRTLAQSIHQTRAEIALISILAIEAAFGGDLDMAARYACEVLSTSSVEEPDFSLAFGLVVTVRVAAALGEHMLAARIAGRVGDALTAAMPTVYGDDYAETLDGVRRALGSAAFELNRQSGADSSWLSIATEAQEYLQGVGLHEEAGGRSPERSATEDLLTDRQLEVVNLLANGLTNKEIAGRLGVTTKTVMHHTSAIYTRLGVRGRSEAVAWAVREGRVVAPQRPS